MTMLLCPSLRTPGGGGGMGSRVDRGRCWSPGSRVEGGVGCQAAGRGGAEVRGGAMPGVGQQLGEASGSGEATAGSRVRGGGGDGDGQREGDNGAPVMAALR
jgi:hypothetical protein